MEVDRILVVDDSQSGRYLKAHLLRRAGYDVSEAGTGQEGLDLIAQNDFALAVVDLKLPDMSGIDVCASIKALHSRVMVLHTSAAYTGYQERAAGLAGGADGYMIEPLEPEEFLATIEALLRRHRTERDLAKAVAESGQRIVEIDARLQAEISQRTEAEDMLRHAQKLDVLGQLTGGIAHDFNNVLTIIMGNLESLRRHIAQPSPDVARIKHHVDHAFFGAQRAMGVTRQLLAFSRRQPLDPAVINLNTSVESLVQLLQQVVGEKIVVTSRLGPELWPVYVDAGQLETAILNLVVNARDAMISGGGLTIETGNVSHTQDHDKINHVLLRVTDTGVGMSNDTMRLAFEPFFTTKDVGHGTGLGLSQVYGFVTQSGGSVQLQSAPGKGTSIEIYLPRYDGPLRPIGEGEEEILTQPHVRQGATILVVEDDEGVRTHTAGVLREMGYKIREAGTANDALALLERDPTIALLFTDVGLPGGLSGAELGKIVTARFPSVPVIYASAYARERLRKAGIADTDILVSKPFTYQMVGKALNTVFARNDTSGDVLVVEDEPMIRMELVDSLNEAGFRVKEAASSGEALRLLGEKGSNIAALVTDIGLPDGRGDDLARQARAGRSELPVVVTTGYSDAATRKSFGDGAHTAFIVKPYRPEQIADALRRMGVHQQGPTV